MEDGGKLLRECEQAAVGGRLLIAQGMEEASGCKAIAGDAGREPGLIYLGEETGDLTPAGAFTGLAGIADEHDVEVQTMAGGIDHAVGSATDQVAEDGQELEEKGGRMGLGVGSDGADGESGKTVESGFTQGGIRGGCGGGRARCFGSGRRSGRRWRIWTGFGLGVSFGLRLAQKGEEFGLASLYIGERRYVGASDAGSSLSSSFGHCYPFRKCLIGADTLDFPAG
jgi:hypothetical protein